MAAKDVWQMRATWAQRQRLRQQVRTYHVHYAWMGYAVCGEAQTGAELTALASLVTCPACRTMSVWALASLAEASREITILVNTRLGAAMAALGRAFGAGGSSRTR